MSIAELFAGPWGPLIIFFLRICDVSLSTVRIMLMMRNAKLIVPVIALAETLIWVFGVGNAIKNLDSPLHIAGYALGFTLGNVVGMWIEEKLAYGYIMARVIGKNKKGEVAKALRDMGFGVTEFAAKGMSGAVEMFLTVLPRKDLERLTHVVRKLDPEALVSVEEIRSVSSNWRFPAARR